MQQIRLNEANGMTRWGATLLHPVVLFTVVWGGVFLLYSMHLSNILIYTNSQVLRVLLVLWAPLLLASFLYSLARSATRIVIPETPGMRQDEDLDRLDRRLAWLFRFWLIVTAFETVVSGGIPLLWLLAGSSKTYVDFGIPSVHGFVNALILAIALCRMALFFKTGERRHLKVPIFLAAWTVFAISRNLLLVSAIEIALIYVAMKGIKLGTIFRIGGAAIALILVFGIVGDLRSGADSFRELAQPTANYPDWLPSGVLWVYIYVTTPINNLIHTSLWMRPLNNIFFPNTAVSLFPTVVRKFIYGYDPSDSLSGNLVADAFNVSTAYIGPVQDYGFYGMAAFSFLIGVVCQIFYHQTRLRGVIIYAVLAQCLLLTVFFNHFFFLPVIFQVVWIFAIFVPEVQLV